jgi:ubiquinone/menaquinone biosynthesis C-methylase UbiE
MTNKIWLQLVRFGFRLLYNELAWMYDGVSWAVSLGEWRTWQLSAIPFLHGPRVLELGHGPGHLLLALAEAGFQVVGAELSPFMSQIARRRLRQAGYRPLLLRADGRCLPLAAATFDSIVATFPTNYIIEPETLAAVHRLLKAGGRFVIVPTAMLSNPGPLTRFIEWLYTITGQSATSSVSSSIPDPFANALQQAAFSPTTHTISLARSSVTIIVADKV